jgi:hypothetical protein
MVEIPPGSATTYAATAVLAQVIYDSTIDKLIIASTGGSGVRSYITDYNTTSDPFNHIFLVDTKQSNQSTAAVGNVVHPSIAATPISIYSIDGILFLVKISASTITSFMYSMPIGADWAYAETTEQMIISRKIDTSDATKFLRAYSAGPLLLGSDVLGLSPEPYRLFWRTTGIDDNSGSWTLIPESGDISNITPGANIQFAVEFRTIGLSCVPSYVYSIGLVYEDSKSIEAYSPSLQFTSASSLVFAWRQVEAVDGYNPALNITITNIDTDNIVLDDDTDVESSGTFEYSTDNGLNWVGWDSNAFAIDNYIRYAANSLPASIRARARISYA